MELEAYKHSYSSEQIFNVFANEREALEENIVESKGSGVLLFCNPTASC